MRNICTGLIGDLLRSENYFAGVCVQEVVQQVYVFHFSPVVLLCHIITSLLYRGSDNYGHR